MTQPEQMYFISESELVAYEQLRGKYFTHPHDDMIDKIRSRPAPATADQVLKLAADIWGVAACIQKENTDEFMVYFEKRMNEFERRYEELRQQERDP
jgi:hypothetical protein